MDEGGGGGSRLGTSVASGVGAPSRDGRGKEEFVRVADASEVEAARTRYSPDKPRWHDYGTENEVCPTEWQCSPEEMADQLARFAFPGQDPAKPAQSGSINLVVDPATGITAGYVFTEVLDNGLRVVNTTLPGHILHDGQVERRAARQSDGGWQVRTRGVGSNVKPEFNLLNEQVGPEVFNTLDRRLRENRRRATGVVKQYIRQVEAHEHDATHLDLMWKRAARRGGYIVEGDARGLLLEVQKALERSASPSPSVRSHHNKPRKP